MSVDNNKNDNDNAAADDCVSGNDDDDCVSGNDDDESLIPSTF